MMAQNYEKSMNFAFFFLISLVLLSKAFILDNAFLNYSSSVFTKHYSCLTNWYVFHFRCSIIFFFSPKLFGTFLGLQ